MVVGGLDLPLVIDGLPSDVVVQRGYDRVAQEYARLESTTAEWPRSQRLRELLDQLPENSKILDVGCGNGIPAMRLIQKRHIGVGVDISGTQVSLARKNVPEATFIRGNIMQLQFPTSSFSAIVSFYAIDHLPREQHLQLFRRFYSWLRPGGRLLFTTEPHDQPGVTADWLGVSMFFSQFGPDTTERLLTEAGLTVTDRSIESQREGETDIQYVWYSATKLP